MGFERGVGFTEPPGKGLVTIKSRRALSKQVSSTVALLTATGALTEAEEQSGEVTFVTTAGAYEVT